MDILIQLHSVRIMYHQLFLDLHMKRIDEKHHSEPFDFYCEEDCDII